MQLVQQKIQSEMNFIKQYKKSSYEIFRDSLELKDFIEWKQISKQVGRPIQYQNFVTLFDTETETYNNYHEYLYWYEQYKILESRSKFTLIQGGLIN